MERKYASIAKTVLDKKDKVEEIHLPNFETYYITTVTKTVVLAG